MRILLWAPFGAGEHYWGPGTSAFRLYKSNRNEEHTITLVHACNEQEYYNNIYVEQIKLPTLKNTGLLGKIRYFVAAKKWINNNYDRFDVVHGITGFEYTFRPALHFLKHNVPVYIKITGHYGGFGNASWISKILGLSNRRIKNANNITGYIAISEAIASNLANNGISLTKIHKIPNGVDTHRFHPIPQDKVSNHRNSLNLIDCFTVTYIGGLTFNKQIVEIVQAVRILIEKGINMQLLLVGPDRCNGSVINEINEILKDKVFYKQFVYIEYTNKPELYYQASDLFILNSKEEGLSNSLLEAMACGLPCIVTKISGSEDLIKDEINGLYTDGTSEDLSKKIEILIKDQELLKKLSVQALKVIQSKYSIEKIFNSHIEIFQS